MNESSPERLQDHVRDRGQDHVQESLQKACELARGRVALAVQRLDDGQSFSFGTSETFPVASVIKWPLHLLLHERAQRGEIDLDEARAVEESEAPGGTGLLEAMRPRVLTLRDAAFLMIAVSDNLAANRVIAALGGLEAANEALRERFGEGLSLEGWAVFEPQQETPSMGIATAGALLDFLVGLNGSDDEATRASKWAALHALDRSMLPRELPRQDLGGDEVRVTHKSGTLPGVRADAGILEHSGRAVAVVVLTEGLTGTRFEYDDPAERWIGARARVIAREWLGFRG